MRIEPAHRAILQRLAEDATLTHEPHEGWSLNLHDGLLPLALRSRDTLFLRELGLVDGDEALHGRRVYRLTEAGKEALELP